uniref:hypothetical protein n=1 Tax=Streptomyces sp. F2 TaxID=317660 RepID=UPI0015E8711E|nr:hypothetical protein [Streptomyces sp. F2]
MPFIVRHGTDSRPAGAPWPTCPSSTTTASVRYGAGWRTCLARIERQARPRWHAATPDRLDAEGS